VVIGITIAIYTNCLKVLYTIFSRLYLVVHHTVTAKQLTKQCLVLSVLIDH